MVDKKKILVIEDNELNLRMATTILERSGYSVIQAVNGKLGLEKYREEYCDLILMDIFMPVMDGKETIRAIRNLESDKSYPRVPIIAVSAFAYDDNEDECYQAGVDKYITKPYNPMVLLDLIEELLD